MIEDVTSQFPDQSRRCIRRCSKSPELTAQPSHFGPELSFCWSDFNSDCRFGIPWEVLMWNSYISHSILFTIFTSLGILHLEKISQISQKFCHTTISDIYLLESLIYLYYAVYLQNFHTFRAILNILIKIFLFQDIVIFNAVQCNWKTYFQCSI